MNAVQTRQHPACTRNDVNTTKKAVRAAYHGVTSVCIAQTPRHPLTIASELRGAAECPASIAEDFAAGATDEHESNDVDRMLVGLWRLIMKLRLRQGASL